MTKPSRMADMPAQQAADPATSAQARARYFNSGNAFNLKLPPVPAGVFVDPYRLASAADAQTGAYPCDQSGAIQTAGSATTPFMLAQYIRLRGGHAWQTDLHASGALAYVIAGSGESRQRDERIVWAAGDVLFFPGGASVTHNAQDALIWWVTDEPLLRAGQFAPRESELAIVHFPHDEIERQLAVVLAAEPDADTSGRALIFSSDALADGRNILPTLTLSLNTLQPGAAQSPHRHNSAALTLIVDGPQGYSMVDEQPCPWSPWATLVTPAGAPHSHHNPGRHMARFLIVQDGALYYQARTMGFVFL